MKSRVGIIQKDPENGTNIIRTELFDSEEDANRFIERFNEQQLFPPNQLKSANEEGEYVVIDVPKSNGELSFKALLLS